MQKIQRLMAVPPMREKVASDEHGLRSFLDDRFKELLKAAYSAVEVGD